VERKKAVVLVALPTEVALGHFGKEAALLLRQVVMNLKIVIHVVSIILASRVEEHLVIFLIKR